MRDYLWALRALSVLINADRTLLAQRIPAERNRANRQKCVLSNRPHYGRSRTRHIGISSLVDQKAI